MTAPSHHRHHGTRARAGTRIHLPLLAAALLLSPLVLLAITLAPAPAVAHAHPLHHHQQQQRSPEQRRHLQPAPQLEDKDQSPLFTLASPRRRKIAIIGSGPSGSSAAYWLYKAQQALDQRGELPEYGFDVHVYEREEEVSRSDAEGDKVAVAGARGRVKAVYPYGDASGRYDPVELGASIFADVNHNLQRIAKDFGLRTGAHLGEDGSETAVWDGSQFVLDDLGDSWWSSAKLFWRYGYSPVTTRNLVSELKDQFTQLYTPRFLHERSAGNPNVTASGFPWRSLSKMATALGFDDALAHDAQSWFYGKGVSQLFIQELIEAATRVNYAQNTDTIHALGAGVSMAASGATGIQGGNWQIFQQMLDRSGAIVHTGARGEVTGIVKFGSLAEARAAGKVGPNDSEGADVEELDADADASAAPKWWVGTAAGTGGLYDAVFVAAPWHASGITLMGTDTVIPTTDYVRLHVTLVATSAPHPNPLYFGRSRGEDVPTTILTSYAAVRKALSEKASYIQPPVAADVAASFSLSLGGVAALWHAASQWLGAVFFVSSPRSKIPPKLEFNSLNYIAKLPPPPSNLDSQEQYHLVKIFSLAPLEDYKLIEILEPDHGYVPANWRELGLNLTGGSTIHWVHRAEWDAYPFLRPSEGDAAAAWPPLQPAPGLFYINALEPLVSTMETSTVSARNAVALLLEEWYGLGLVVGGDDGECEWKEAGEVSGEKNWDGWGCYAA